MLMFSISQRWPPSHHSPVHNGITTNSSAVVTPRTPATFAATLIQTLNGVRGYFPVTRDHFVHLGYCSVGV